MGSIITTTSYIMLPDPSVLAIVPSAVDNEGAATLIHCLQNSQQDHMMRRNSAPNMAAGRGVIASEASFRPSAQYELGCMRFSLVQALLRIAITTVLAFASIELVLRFGLYAAIVACFAYRTEFHRASTGTFYARFYTCNF
eukprot:1746937-Amphidinium_carterae.1